MKEVFIYEDKRKVKHVRHRTRTFSEAWKLYMREEQKMLDLLLAAEAIAIEKDPVKLYQLDDVLESLEKTMNIMGYTAMKAIRLFASFEGVYVEELEREAA